MTDQELRVYVNNIALWAKKTRDALNAKQADAKRAVESELSQAATTEIAAKHDQTIANHRAPFTPPDPQTNDPGNPYGEPTRQQAIDSLLNQT